jgi:hypothetical protein
VIANMSSNLLDTASSFKQPPALETSVYAVTNAYNPALSAYRRSAILRKHLRPPVGRADPNQIPEVLGCVIDQSPVRSTIVTSPTCRCPSS